MISDVPDSANPSTLRQLLELLLPLVAEQGGSLLIGAVAAEGPLPRTSTASGTSRRSTPAQPGGPVAGVLPRDAGRRVRDAGAAQRRVLSSGPGPCTLPRTLPPAPSRHFARTPHPPRSQAPQGESSPLLVPMPDRHGSRAAQNHREAGGEAGLGQPEGHHPPRRHQARPAGHVVGDHVLRRTGCRHAPAGQQRRVLVAARRELGHLQLPHPPREQQPELHAGGRAYATTCRSTTPRTGRRGTRSWRRSFVLTPRATSTPWPSVSASRRSSGTPDLDLRAGPRGSTALRRLPTTATPSPTATTFHIGQNLRGANSQTTAYTGWNWCEPRGGMCS